MGHSRLEAFARLIVEYSTEIRPGDLVMIWGFPLEPEALPLVSALYRSILKAGAYPIVQLNPEELVRLHFQHASPDTLDRPNPIARLVYETFDAEIAINAGRNPYHLAGIPPGRINQVSRAQAEIVQTFLQRSAHGEHRWLGTIYPTVSTAQQLGMSLPDFEDFFYRCTFADRDDPVSAWREFATELERIIQGLDGARQVHLKGPDADLSFSIEGRNILSAAGRQNLPDGEIETSPVEDTVNGWIRFSIPATVRGRDVSGIELHFSDGRVEEASAPVGQEYLLETLDTDAGARYVGEFAFGMNPHVDRNTRMILFDEKMAGTVHLALGNGYPESGSRNTSAIHWDLVCDMRKESVVVVDGEEVYRSGRFLI